jgi:RNA polymerase subunit RPABC4/transcription elongation factor Spt4
MTREIDLSVLDVYAGLPELTVESGHTAVTFIACRNCSRSMDSEEVECPSCGTINLSRNRRRQVENRPERSVAAEIESGNYNGKYQIFRNSDGSYSCNCLSFLFQKEVQNGVGFATCKHVRDHLNSNPVMELDGVRKPSQWQNAALKRFGVAASGYLTDAQAYFLFRDLLAKQGVEYREYEGLLREHLTVNLLPIYSFGVEFEMLVRNRQELEQKLIERNLPAYQTGYDHSMTNSWKLGHDSSIRIEPGYDAVEVVSPKLFGAHGFDTIKRVLVAAGEAGAKLNASCGFHVHVDAWNWDTNLMLELAKVWAKIEIPVLWYLVSPSRRGNSFCKPLEVDDLVMLAEGRLTDRYHSLNLCAFQRHKTVEFRLHNGTAEAQKAIPWVVFCLMLTNAVTKGLRSRDIEPTFEGVMDAIGMNDGATSVIREAKNYLYGRYTYWKEDAERNPSRTMRIESIDTDGFDLERELTRRRRQAERMELRGRRDTLRSSYYSRHTRFMTANPELPPNSVTNLASMRPSSVISIEEFEGGYDAGAWDVPSRNGDARYAVTLERESDNLVCACRGFRTHRHCWHTINVARYIAVRRQEAEMDIRLREFDQEEVNNQCAG